MKKSLLYVVAVSLCAASSYAADYGTTPETAVPMPTGGWEVKDLASAPTEAWFTFTSNQATPAMWGDGASDWTNPTPLGQQVFVYLCNDGQEAFQMSPGTDSYILFPGQEYLVKVTPKAVGLYCMNQPNPLPTDRFEGKQKYYPIVVAPSELGRARTVAPGTTTWYELTVPYPTQIAPKSVASPMTPASNIDKIEAIHIECPGGSDTGDLIVGPYVKAGKNVVGITASASATEDVSFILGYNAFGNFNCGNNLLRSQNLELDAKNTYPDAYYTVDRFFKVPEDGNYTFINHGAKGTILNVGMVKLTDPADAYKFECDWSNIKTATVGNEDAVVVMTDLKKDDIVAVQSDAFGVIGAGMDNLPYLMVKKGGSSNVSEIVEEGNTLKVNASNGKLTVESVLLASGAEVAVYDMSANKVASTFAAEGDSSLEMSLDVTPGVYVVVVYGKGNSESVKIAVK